MVATMKALKRNRIPVLVTMQQKGGVGKTTIAKMLGVYFAKARQIKVLMMDFDPQCNLSNKFMVMVKRQGIEGYFPPVHPDYDPSDEYDWDGHSSCAQLFADGGLVPYPTYYENLDIVPAEGERLTKAEQNLPDEITQRVINRPREWLTHADVQAEYDLVIIDTPPSRQALSRGALRAATHVLVPMEPEQNSQEGLSDMLEMWRNENLHREPNDPAEMLGILPNQVQVYGKNTMSLHAAIMENLRQDPAISPFMLKFSIRQKPFIAETDFPEISDTSEEMKKLVPKTALDLPAKDNVRREAEVVCRHVESRIFGDVTG